MKRLPFILLLLLLVTAGCVSRSDRQLEGQLDRIDAMMEAHPDSALEALRALSIDTAVSPSLRARHALLLSQALDKNFIDLTSDSVIAPALDYYIPRNDRKYLGRTLYYQGRIFEHQGNHEGALRSFLEAEKYLIATEDHLMLGKTYQNIGMIFYNLFFEIESLDFLKRALKELEIDGDSINVGYISYLLSNASHFADRNEDALRYAERAMEIARITGNQKLLSYSVPAYAISLADLGDYNKAYEIINFMDSGSMSSLEDVEILAYIDICRHEGDTVLAESLLHSIQAPAMGPFDYLVDQGRYKEAYETAMSLIDSMNTIICDISRQGLTSTMNEFNRSEIERGVIEKNSLRRNAIVVISAIVIILLLIVILYRKAIQLARERQRNLKVQEERYELLLTNLTNELKESELSRLSAERKAKKKTAKNSVIFDQATVVLTDCASHSLNRNQKNLLQNLFT